MQKFEGIEKKLEFVLLTPQSDLRDNSDGRWDNAVKASGAEIISRIISEEMDAYLLSESSLFVWDDRILLITCGKTAPILAVPEILKYVDKSNIAFVFYERKNLMFPQDQPTDFDEEVARLQAYFPGESRRLGTAEGDHVHVFYSSPADSQPVQDATLQVLMHQLNPSLSKEFEYQHSEKTAGSKTLIQLDNIYPSMLSDHYFFYPQGYSLNAVSGTSYYTIHVTPQAQGSFASFETNVMEKDYSGVISKIVSVFDPGRFSVVLTTTCSNGGLSRHDTLKTVPKGYKPGETIRHNFDNDYTATFLNFTKT